MTQARVALRVRSNNFTNLETMTYPHAFNKTSAYFAREFDRMFTSEGASRGHPWKPLSRAYAAQKARRGYSPKILHRKGILRASHTTLSITQHSLTYGWPATITHARAHDKGTKWLPSRPLIVILPRDVERIGRFFRDDIRTQGTTRRRTR